MWRILAFCGFLILAHTVPIEKKEKVERYYNECFTETGADSALVEKASKGDYTFNDAKVKSFYACMMKKVGIMDDKGIFLEDVALTQIEESEKADVRRAFDACRSKKVENNISESAWKYVECYNIERPGKEDFF